jgi:class 3 adenylate cyclase
VVNRNLGETVFKKTERGENKTFDNGHFREVLDTIAPKRVELRNRREMEYYFPILNLPDCRVCHGSDHFIRGVAYFRASTQGVSDQIRNANLLLTGMFVIAGILISAVLVLFLRRTVTSPILTIGGTVLKVGKGDFGVRVPVKSSDEIGRLGKEINQMIQGLENRFHFPKYVAKTTENLMRKRGEIRTDGERQNLTVLFSDIRQFTRFSKSNQPAEVIKTLNRFLQVQAETVEKFQGDIDKFIGDAIMALFTDEYTAVQCAYHMIASVRSLDRELGSGLRVGIGINAGEVVLGNIGSERRLEFGVIGDVVNMASRLSSIASPNMILISESVMKKLEGRVRAKLISDQQVNRKLKKLNFFVVQEVKDESTQRWMR